MASLCAASRGASASSTRWMVSSMFAEASAEKTLEARWSSVPERSIATIVLSKVGAAVSAAIAATSASCRRMPSSRAGWKSPS